MRDIKTRGIIYVGLGIEVARSFIQAALNCRDPCTFTIGRVHIEHGAFITVITGIPCTVAAAVVGIGIFAEVACTGIGAARHHRQTKLVGNSVSVIRITHRNNDRAFSCGKHVITIHITRAPLATKHAISVFVGNGQYMASVDQAPLPDLFCFVCFIRLWSDAGQLISAFANDGPPHFFGPAIRCYREHHIRARVFTPAVVEGRIFVVIQGIGVRTTRNKRAAIRRAECDRVAHQGIEREEHLVRGIGHQTSQRQGRGVAQIFSQQLGEFTCPIFRSRILVAHDVRGTEEIRKRSVQGGNGQHRIGSHVVHTFSGRREGLDGAVYRAASSHRQVDRVRYV